MTTVNKDPKKLSALFDVFDKAIVQDREGKPVTETHPETGELLNVIHSTGRRTITVHTKSLGEVYRIRLKSTL